MKKISLHNHTNFSFDSETPMETMVESAIKNGFSLIGFSEHQDFDPALKEYHYFKYDSFTNEFERVKSKYKDQITLYKSIEIDYQSRYETDIRNYLLNKEFDYIIGSVHYLESQPVDLPKFKENTKTHNELAELYLLEIEKMVKSKLFQVVGHFDLVKLYSSPINTTLFRKKIIEIFDIMKEQEMILEINYAGLRKLIKESYPSIDILRLYYENGNRLISVSADAHSDSHFGFNPDLSFIKEVGFSSLFTNCKGKILDYSIK